VPDELQSRLRLAESEAEHKLRTQGAEDALKRKISLMVHVFVMAIVAIAFLASVYIAVAKDPKTGLPDQAMGIITAIVAAGVGYVTGKGSKSLPHAPMEARSWVSGRTGPGKSVFPGFEPPHWSSLRGRIGRCAVRVIERCPGYVEVEG